MARFNPIQNTFTAGELSPRLEARDDVEQYASGMRQALNGIPLPFGGFIRRPGTRFIEEVKDSADAGRLMRFQVSTDQPYVIEAGDLYFRFYVNEGRLESGGAVEVATPYTSAQIPDVQYAQEGDVAYFVHPNHPTYKLSRTSATTFTFARVAYRNGRAPLRQANLGATTVTYTAPSSVPTLTWSASIGLSSADVGRYVRATSGSHEVWVLITAVVDNKTATGTLAGSSGTPTSVTGAADWALGAESATEGFRAIAFHQGRLGFFGARTTAIDTFWLSKSDDYENFEIVVAGDTDAENADKSISRRVKSNQVNACVWAISADEVLIVGTTGGEFRISGDSDGILTPTSTSVEPSTNRGGKNVAPIVINDNVIFVQRNGRKLREYKYDLAQDGRIARELSILAEHLFRDGIKEMDYQQDPNSVIWVVTDTGALVSMTYEEQQRVYGCARHRIGGSFQGGPAIVESIVVVPDPDETHDQIWLLVKRTIDGATVRYVELMEHQFEPLLTAESTTLERIAALDDAFFIDSGLSLDVPVTITGITAAEPGVVTAAGHGFSDGDTVRLRGVVGMTEVNNRSYKVANKTTDTFELTDIDDDSDIDTSGFGAYVTGGTVRREVTSVSGLDHLEGETVQILADGATHPDEVVSSGAVALDRPASIVRVGMGFRSVGETQRFSGGGRMGSDQGQIGRIQRVVVRLLNTLGASLGTGPSLDRLEDLPTRKAGDHMDMAPPLFSGDYELPVSGGFTREKTVCFVQDLPLPMHVLAVMPKMEVGER